MVSLFNLSASSLQTLLTTDPRWTMEYIVALNGQAVADNLANIGFNRPSNSEQALVALRVLLERGQYSQFAQALSVPMGTSNLDYPLVATTLSANRDWQGKADHMKFAVGETQVGTDNVLSGLAVGILTMLGLGSSTTADGGDGAGTTVNGGTGTTNPGGGGAPGGMSNWTIAAIVVGVVVVGIALVWGIRKLMKG